MGSQQNDYFIGMDISVDLSILDYFWVIFKINIYWRSVMKLAQIRTATAIKLKGQCIYTLFYLQPFQAIYPKTIMTISSKPLVELSTHHSIPSLTDK